MCRLRFLACLLTLCVSGCATNGPEIIDTGCSWVRPIMVSNADVLTDETAREILTHNEAWSAICEKQK
jgi:hypothetical protein